MTSSSKAPGRPRVGAFPVRGGLAALWPARGGRAALHVALGLPLGAGAAAVLFGLVVLWLAALWSLVEDPTGGPVLAALYVVVTVAGPVALPWCVRALGAAQRARFRAVLGVRIPAPPPVAGGGVRRLVGPWTAPATWRQFGYHLLAVVLGVGGGAVLVTCWSAVFVAVGYAGDLRSSGRPLGAGAGALVLALVLLLAAPRAAWAVAGADTVVARTLLGPGRAEALASRVESLSRSRAEILAATDAERRRIERDLHDGAQQRLVSLAMNLGMARAALADESGPTRRAIEEAHDEAVRALAELREFVRGLHPAVLNDRGLDAALSGLAARAPLPVRLRVDVADRCPPSVEAVAYFVVSEALTNVAKHADAAHAEVTVERTGDRLRVVVIDDGRGGARLAPTGESGPAGGGGSGLRGLAQRTAAVDGTFALDSPPGGPTTIEVELPCGS